ncbi:MAG: EF-P beta-lysylation protein EpmB [Candidatus Dasytiphilus stammeri]
MKYCIPGSTSSRELWLQQLSDVVTETSQLLQMLKLNHENFLILSDQSRRKFFPLRVPRTFIARMRHGDPYDPLLLQVLINPQEFIKVPSYSSDPLQERDYIVCPGLIHKYHNRALLLVKGSCAVHCRYCFRRSFPYQEHSLNQKNFHSILEYLHRHSEIEEIIFSGGDPLMAKDYELKKIISQLENIRHLKRLRIHTRLPVVIPSRITQTLCHILHNTKFKIILVTHINHQQEIDHTLPLRMEDLKKAGVTLLNQSVLLRGVNDSSKKLAALSNALFDIGILPYYLHMLDQVEGAAHFFVSEEKAQSIMRNLFFRLSGYLVPTLIREVNGKKSKIPVDLNFR